MIDSFKNKILLPWYIILILLSTIILFTLFFVSHMETNISYNKLLKENLIDYYNFKSLHDELYISNSVHSPIVDREGNLDIISKKIEDSYKMINLTTEKLEEVNDTSVDRYRYENIKILSDELIKIYGIINALNSQQEQTKELYTLLDSKILIFNAILEDIIVKNERNEGFSYQETVDIIITNYIILVAITFLIVVGSIFFIIYQIKSISIPTNRLLKELDKVENGEDGNFTGLSKIKEIKLISKAISRMILSINDSKTIILDQKNILSDKVNELHKIQEELSLTQKHAQLGRWFWFPQREFYIPELTKQIFHLEKKYFTRKDLFNLIPDFNRSYIIKKIFDQLRNSKNLHIDIELNDKIWIYIAGKIIRDDRGHITEINGTVQNITYRAIKERERKELSMAIKQSSESIVITDLETNIIFVNDAFAELSGYSKKELIGAKPALLSSGKTLDKTYKGMWKTLNRGEGWKGIFYNKKKNGEEYIEFATITPLKRDDGSVYRYVGVKEDITERKRLGEDLDKYREQLEELVAKRTEELALALNLAEESSKAKETFIANMSHEIRTPMNAILGVIHLIRETKLDKLQKQYIDQVDIAGRLLLSIINDILDYSKAEAGMMTLVQENISIKKTLSNIEKMMSPQAQEKQLYFTIINNAAADGIYIDRLRLTQAIVNLVNNAIKFTETGGITLKIETVENTKSHITLHFSVQDTGQGISDDFKQKIFTPFKQVNDSYSRQQGGSGLGLVITHKIIDLMEGDIGFTSDIGIGSNFWFTISCPKIEIEKEDSKEDIDDSYKKLTSLDNLNILIADDDQANRFVISGLFNDDAFRISLAKDGFEVLDIFNSETEYDVILMDIQMPRMDGLEATKKMRLIDPLTPIIALTANVSQEDNDKCLDVGMDDFIIKPYSPTIIYSTLYKWVSIFNNDRQYIDLRYIKNIFANNWENYLTVTNIFFNTYEDLVVLDMNRELIHKLKGSSGNIGLHKIMNECKNAMKNLSDIGLKKQIISSIAESKKIIEKISARIDRNKEVVEKPLIKLLDLLKENNATSIHLYRENVDQIKKVMSLSDFTMLDKSISSFDFSKSIEICKKYI